MAQRFGDQQAGVGGVGRLGRDLRLLHVRGPGCPEVRITFPRRFVERSWLAASELVRARRQTSVPAPLVRDSRRRSDDRGSAPGNDGSRMSYGRRRQMVPEPKTCSEATWPSLSL